jgi:hypothetical protein
VRLRDHRRWPPRQAQGRRADEAAASVVVEDADSIPRA